MRLGKLKFISVLVAVALFAPALSLLAQTADTSQKQAEKAALEQQLQVIQNEIDQYEQQLAGISSQKNTLNNKIKQLKTQQAKIKLQIEQANLAIKNIEQQLDQTGKNIESQSQRLERLKQEVAHIILTIDQKDQTSLVEVLVSDGGWSGFYDHLNDYQKISQSLRQVLSDVRATITGLHEQEKQLADQQNQQENFIQIQGIQNQQLGQTLGEQTQLLQQTKGREADYQLSLKDARKRAAEISNRIYDLLGISRVVTFGEAVGIAQFASKLTGVRAAFLLAVLTQESNLGKNVGTCNRLGDPPEKSWRAVMKPDRDQPPFLAITQELGLDPDTTPVSCPMRDSKGRRGGWGGAMGPAQFIPSTWGGYKDQVTNLTGKLANPFDIRDAFLAAAIKLRAGGAGTQDGEWAAAMRYFSGGTNTKYRFYGDSVVEQANRYQGDIESLAINAGQ